MLDILMIARVLYCHHVVHSAGRIMEISDLVPSSSVSVEGVFVGSISPIKTSRTNIRSHSAHNVTLRRM